MAIDTSEFKNIIETNIALAACDSLLTLEQQKSALLYATVRDYEAARSVYRKRIDMLEGALVSREPAWFDRFVPGFIAGTLVTVAVVVLVR